MTTFQTNTTVTAAGPTVIAATPQTNINVCCIRGLGITQIIFGFLAICFGIGTTAGIAKGYWVNESGSGVWFGLWILVTGIIGVCSAQKPMVRSLNGAHMGFSIVCTVVSFFVGIFFAIGLGYYNSCTEIKYNWWGYYYRDLTCKNKAAGVGLYALLLLLMIAEFFVSLIAAVYCCQGANGCCNNGVSGVVVHQTGNAVTTSNGQTFIMTGNPYPVVNSYPANGYPATSIHHAGGQTQFIQQAYAGQGQVFMPQQTVMTQPVTVAPNNFYPGNPGVPEYQKTAPPPYSSAMQ